MKTVPAAEEPPAAAAPQAAAAATPLVAATAASGRAVAAAAPAAASAAGGGLSGQQLAELLAQLHVMQQAQGQLFATMAAAIGTSGGVAAAKVGGGE